MRIKQLTRLPVVAIATGLVITAGPIPPAVAAGGPNLAAGRRPVSA